MASHRSRVSNLVSKNGSVCHWKIRQLSPSSHRLRDDVLDTDQPSILLIRIVNDTLMEILRDVVAIVVRLDLPGLVVCVGVEGAQGYAVRG